MIKILLVTGGIINLGLGLFHLGFWKIFNWSETLASLDFMNKAIMQTLNVHVAAVVFFFGFVSIWYPHEMVSTVMGRILSAAIMGFYFLRAANQLIFWDIGHPLTWVLTIAFVAVGGLYLVPLLIPNQDSFQALPLNK